jgi:hypothetical protein
MGLFPPAYRFFVALERSSSRPLAGPTESSQDAPHVARVVPNTALDFDQFGDTTGRPQSIVEAQRLRSALQPSLDSAQIRRSQARWPSDLLRFAKRPTSAILQLLRPATD